MTACFEFNKLMVVIVAGFFMTSCGSPSGSSDPSRNHGTTSPPISVSVAPPNGSLQTSNTQNFTATVQNDSQDKGVTWSLSGAGCSGTSCGTLSAASSDSGVPITYTAPIAVPNPATVSLTAASATDNTKTGTATVTITAAPPPISVSIAPPSASVQSGNTQAFAATVQNDSQDKGVTWSLSGAGCSGTSCGTLSAASSASGMPITYTAPIAVPNPASVSLTATSVADNTKSAVAAITVTAASTGSVSLSPKRGGLVVSQSLTFAATVTNDVGNAGVTWSSTSGAFSNQTTTSATFTAPSSAGLVSITATSKADPTKSVSATIGVTDLAGVRTYHNDLSRDGVNSHEYALTTANVASSTFGKLFSCIADGAIYAQPLWVPNVAIAGGTHNVIVVVTMRDSVYVFDADTSPCVTYWQQTLIPSGETYGNYSDLGSEDIYPNIGILGTPVIDSSSNTIYLVTKTKTTGTTYFQRLHALDLATGAEKSNSPVAITGSAVFVAGDCEGGTTVAFNPKTQNQRPGLALVNGVVYVTWASHGDVNPFHGWVVGYRTSDLSISGIFNTSPTSTGVGYCRGGIWMSGGAPAADSNNNLYVMTGNGVFDGVADFGDSFLKLNTSSGLSLSDWFTPFNESSLDQADQDVGASGTALLIDQPTGPVTHLLVGGSKNSVIYVLNRDNMSHFNTTTDMVVQEFAVNGHSFSTPGFWNNRLYYFGVQFGGTQVGQSFTFDPSSGMFTTTASSQTPSGFGFPGATPSISATPEGANGIVWAIDAKNYGTSNSGSHTAAPAVLHAYDALNLANELWNSSQAAGGRDTPGNAVKFTVPTVANGKVYIGTRGDDDTQTNGTRFGELDVYGLLPN